MERPRVLVVEDNPHVLEVMATILEGGFEVITASDGTTALSLIGSAPVEVILTDIRLPDASGFDVLRAAQSRAPTAAVVMMTAYAAVPDAVSAIKLGAYDYVAKPLDADEISLVVARAVAHARGCAAATLAVALPSQNGDDGNPEKLSGGYHRAVEEARDRASHDYLTRLMRAFNGNVTNAAKRAGMTRESLHRVLKKYAVRYRPAAVEPAEGQPSQPGSAGNRDVDRG